MVNNEVVKSISYNQHEILFNIMNLHNNGKPFECDMTYSVGNFYGLHNGYEIPEPRYKFDVCPCTEDTVQIEPNGFLPLLDNSINSIVIDLPFVISPPNAPSMQTEQKGRNIIAKRFSQYYPASELYKSYEHWIKEAYRVLNYDGILVFKTQMNISGGLCHDTPFYSKICTQKAGFYIKDEFVLLAKQRLISGKIKKQQHSRKYHSYFLVFVKSKSKSCNKVNFVK